MVTKDSVPELNVDCHGERRRHETKATQCKNLHGATFDVVGHLKQVQPARPRWLVIPRDA